MSKLIALLLITVAGFSVGSLLIGARYSEWVLPGGLPLGNVLAAAGLCSLAGAAFIPNNFPAKGRANATLLDSWRYDGREKCLGHSKLP